MKILVACEESQAVTKAFRAKGHEAYSCDIQECSGGHPEWHLHGDVLDYINKGWDLMIAHPPCTYLTHAGIGYFNIDVYGDKAIERRILQLDAAKFFMKIYAAPIQKICLENPVGFINHWLKPTQIIHPYYFGDTHTKKTCLWLRNLPPLQHSKNNSLFFEKTHVESLPLSVQERKPSKNYKGGEKKNRYFVDSKGSHSSKERSKTFPGIAQAMADQWG